MGIVPGACGTVLPLYLCMHACEQVQLWLARQPGAAQKRCMMNGPAVFDASPRWAGPPRAPGAALVRGGTCCSGAQPTSRTAASRAAPVRERAWGLVLWADGGELGAGRQYVACRVWAWKGALLLTSAVAAGQHACSLQRGSRRAHPHLIVHPLLQLAEGRLAGHLEGLDLQQQTETSGRQRMAQCQAGTLNQSYLCSSALAVPWCHRTTFQSIKSHLVVIHQVEEAVVPNLLGQVGIGGHAHLRKQWQEGAGRGTH